MVNGLTEADEFFSKIFPFFNVDTKPDEYSLIKKEDSGESERKTCDKCDFVATRISKLKYHRESVHEQKSNYYCSVCKTGVYFKYNLNNHRNKKHEGTAKILKIGCSLCDNEDEHEVCDTEGDWSVGNTVQREGDRKCYSGRHKCEECEYRSNCKQKVKVHQDTQHIGLVRFSCSSCDFKNYRKNAVQSHILGSVAHAAAKIITLGCELCKNKAAHKKCFKPQNGKRYNETMKQ